MSEAGDYLQKVNLVAAYNLSEHRNAYHSTRIWRSSEEESHSNAIAAINASYRLGVQGTKFSLDVVPALVLEFQNSKLIWADHSNAPFRHFDLKSLPWQHWKLLSFEQIASVCAAGSPAWRRQDVPVQFEVCDNKYVDLYLNEILAKKRNPHFLNVGRYNREKINAEWKWVKSEQSSRLFSIRWISDVANELVRRVYV
jgi:hypothetical protein